MHPPHVPLQSETEAPEIGGPRHAGPRCRLLCDGDDAGRSLVDGGVHLLQEADGIEILATAVLIRSPFAGLAGVVEVEHRGHGVDAQAVDVELLDPVHGVGHQEVAHLGAPEVEDVGAPVGMLATLGVWVLVEGGAVESAEGPGVLGEVSGHPVDDDADTRPVQRVDEVAELVGGAESRGGGEVGGDLVAP